MCDACDDALVCETAILHPSPFTYTQHHHHLQHCHPPLQMVLQNFLLPLCHCSPLLLCCQNQRDVAPALLASPPHPPRVWHRAHCNHLPAVWYGQVPRVQAFYPPHGMRLRCAIQPNPLCRPPHNALSHLICTVPGMHICLGAAVANMQPDLAIAGGLRIRPMSGKVLDPALVIAADSMKSHSAEGCHRPQQQAQAGRRHCISHGHIYRPHAPKTTEATMWTGWHPATTWWDIVSWVCLYERFLAMFWERVGSVTVSKGVKPGVNTPRWRTSWVMGGRRQ